MFDLVVFGSRLVFCEFTTCTSMAAIGLLYMYVDGHAHFKNG